MEKVNPAALTGTSVGLSGAQQTFHYVWMLNMFKELLDFFFYYMQT